MEREIDIEELIWLYLSKWRILLVSSLLCAVLAFCYSTFFMVPVYSSGGTLYITSNNRTLANSGSAQQNVSLSDLVLAQELTKSYTAILTSNTFLKTVAEESNLGYNFKQLKRMISITNMEETEIMKVYVSCTNPVEAQKLANVVLELAPTEIQRIINGGQATVIDPAELPEKPYSPNVKKNTVMGFAAGFILCAAIIFLFYMLDTKIKTADDLYDITEVPVLGSIPKYD